jgi:hypothetical protein
LMDRDAKYERVLDTLCAGNRLMSRAVVSARYPARFFPQCEAYKAIFAGKCSPRRDWWINADPEPDGREK